MAAVAVVVPLLAVTAPQAAMAVSGAISTTDNEGFVGPGTYENQACLNGQGIDCNIYLQKEDVWFSGLPVSAALGEGTYFFAVLSPGGQAAPNDDGTNQSNGELANLSDNVDAYTNRTFTVDGSGNITAYSGTHNRDGNLIQLWDYADTPNQGGVYILAVCEVPDPPSTGHGAPGANPSDCKYDAFKVTSGQEAPHAAAPTIVKDAAGSYNSTYSWTITKKACLHGTSGANCPKTVYVANGTKATFDYTVTATHSATATVSDVKVTGTITVFNPNLGDVTGATVTDKLSDNTVCSVTAGADVTLSPGDNTFAYTCTLSGLPSNGVKNTAKVVWGDQTVDPDGALAAGEASFTTPADVTFTETVVNACVTVTDTFDNGNADTLGTVCVGNDPAASSVPNWVSVSYNASTRTFTFTYSREVTAPNFTCQDFTNSAEIDNLALDTTLAGPVTQTVTVCGFQPGKTMGFWGNTNGQALLASNDAFSTTNAVVLGVKLADPNSGDRCYIVVDSASKSKTILPNTLNGISILTNCTTSSALDSGINVSSMNTLLAQTLAISYNIKYVSGYAGQTISGVGCTAVSPLTGTSTVQDARDRANYLIANAIKNHGSATVTQSQIGAMNTLLGCLNREA
jgi:hypothetical protein